MTIEEFKKKRWTSYEEIIFNITDDENQDVSCMLIGLDFESDLMRLQPIDVDVYEEQKFWTRVEYCRRPRAKLKIVK